MEALELFSKDRPTLAAAEKSHLLSVTNGKSSQFASI